jgi:hypothetical protein
VLQRNQVLVDPVAVAEHQKILAGVFQEAVVHQMQTIHPVVVLAAEVVQTTQGVGVEELRPPQLVVEGVPYLGLLVHCTK